MWAVDQYRSRILCLTSNIWDWRINFFHLTLAPSDHVPSLLFGFLYHKGRTPKCWIFCCGREASLHLQRRQCWKSEWIKWTSTSCWSKYSKVKTNLGCMDFPLNQPIPPYHPMSSHVLGPSWPMASAPSTRHGAAFRRCRTWLHGTSREGQTPLSKATQACSDRDHKCSQKQKCGGYMIYDKWYIYMIIWLIMWWFMVKID